MTYQLTFRPLEPYFFGTERKFKYVGKTTGHQRAGSYHIESDQVPSQTTILGVVRNLLIGKLRKDDFSYTQDERYEIANRIGPNSFDLAAAKWDFGWINSLTPVLLRDKDGLLFIPMPMNHQEEDSKKTEEVYKPFTEKYLEVSTSEGKKKIPTDYDAKKGISQNAWVCLNTGMIHKDLFDTETHVGFNTGVKKGGFFKKSYCRLKDGFAFTCFVDLKDDLQIDNTLNFFKTQESAIVYMGKGKSAFNLTIKENKPDYVNKIEELLADKNPNNADCWAYALSDLYAKAEIFKACDFASTGIHELRARTTDLSGSGAARYQMSEKLYSFIKAGSFFLINDREAFENALGEKNSPYRKIGWNTMIYGGNKK